MHTSVIFREYDIRGVYNEQFDDYFAYELGKSYVTYMKKEKGISQPTVSVGHDARHSCPALVAAVTKGITESGGSVILLGLVTTPVCYFSTFQLQVDGAIQITGSHNPAEYNGFKISVGKTTIFGDEIQKLGRFIQAKDFVQDAKLGEVKTYNIFPEYLERYKKEFGQLKDTKVVLDCGNGAAGSIVKDLFAAVGLTPTILFEKPDGSFPNHHPDPTVEKNLVDLKKAVLAEGAVCGIGFDGDADRIGVVDHLGNMIYGDELMVIIARSIISKNPGAKIIGDVKCSDRLYSDIQSRGGIPIMWKTGHSLVKEKIKVEHAPFGGEMSGHIFFADRNYGYDDAPYAALRLVEIISQTGKTIPELLAGLPKAYNTPELRIDTTEEKKQMIVAKMIETFSQAKDGIKVNLTDGIRLSFNDGWALCRASNTQPVLVLRYESSTEAGLKEIQDQIEAIVNPLLNS